jgi:methionyl-tRNA synthetase
VLWTFEDFGFWALIILCWSIAWKGFALWRAANNDHKGWFVVFLLVNLLGIPEIIYLWWYRDRWPHGF